MKIAADIMTAKPECLHVEDRLEEAWQLMRHKRIRHIPITKRGVTGSVRISSEDGRGVYLISVIGL